MQGRTTGGWRTTPVNLLTSTGPNLVAPGHTHWVKNMRAAGSGELQVGRGSRFSPPTEIADNDKVPSSVGT